MARRTELVAWLREVADPSVLRIGEGAGWPVLAEVNVRGVWYPVALHVSTVIEQGAGRPNSDRCRIEPPTSSRVTAPAGCLPIALGITRPSRTVVLWDVRDRVDRQARSSLYGSWAEIRLAAEKGWVTHTNSDGEPVVAADLAHLSHYVERLLQGQPLLDSPSYPTQFGVPFTPKKRTPRTAPVDPFTIDPTQVERGSQAHEAVVGDLARLLESMSLPPLLPGPMDPEFDLAWFLNGTLYVAEVKSLTDANEDKQLRLGLGQVLWYRHVLAEARGTVRGVLAAERAPRDPRWRAVCEGGGVILVWPGEFERLFLP